MPKIKRHTIKKWEGYTLAELRLGATTKLQIEWLPSLVCLTVQSKETRTAPTQILTDIHLTGEEAKELWAALGEVLATVKTWRAKKRPASTRSRPSPKLETSRSRQTAEEFMQELENSASTRSRRIQFPRHVIDQDAQAKSIREGIREEKKTDARGRSRSSKPHPHRD